MERERETNRQKDRQDSTGQDRQTDLVVEVLEALKTGRQTDRQADSAKNNGPSTL